MRTLVIELIHEDHLLQIEIEDDWKIECQFDRDSEAMDLRTYEKDNLRCCITGVKQFWDAALKPTKLIVDDSATRPLWAPTEMVEDEEDGA